MLLNTITLITDIPAMLWLLNVCLSGLNHEYPRNLKWSSLNISITFISIAKLADVGRYGEFQSDSFWGTLIGLGYVAVFVSVISLHRAFIFPENEENGNFYQIISILLTILAITLPIIIIVFRSLV